YEEFIEQVRRRAHLSSEDEAKRATQATLETLAAYISAKERHDAASQLPRVIKEYMQRPFLGAGKPPAPSPESSQIVEDFYQRLSELEEKQLEPDWEHDRAVMSDLHDRWSGGE